MKTHLTAAAWALSAAIALTPFVTIGCGSSPDENVGQSGSSVTTRAGLDYAWSHPSPQSIHAAGYTFAARYLSYDSSKDITAGEVQALKAAGVDVVANWETNGTDALNGYSSGVSDAQSAESEAKAAGMPDGRPIYFSLDFDASAGQQGAINAYFDGVASVIGRGRTGAYGGYYVIQRLFDAGKIAWAWQTYAWSGGQWDARAQMRQVQNGITVGGVGVDRDEAVADDFGQWGHANGGGPAKVCGKPLTLDPPVMSCNGHQGSPPGLPPKPTGAGAIAAGQGLGPNDTVTSADGRFELAMQSDGNVVLYSSGVPLWTTATAGQHGEMLAMQGDGNLVLYSDTSCALWASNTAGHPGATLAVQDDGNLVIYDAGKAIWDSHTGGVAAKPAGCGSIAAGHGIGAGEAVVSCDGRFALALQGDGNVALSSGGMALWSTGTDCQYGRSLVMQGDGNLVVYANTGAPVWSSGTAGHPGASLAVQDDGNVVIYDQGKALWNSGTVLPGAPGKPTACGRVNPGEGLEVGETHSSCDLRFTLAMQSDGNLVLYENGVKALWSTVTGGKAGFVFYMQGDGNFVLYDTHRAPIWHSNTYGHGGAFLAIQNDGNLVVYSGSTPLWSSGTWGH